MRQLAYHMQESDRSSDAGMDKSTRPHALALRARHPGKNGVRLMPRAISAAARSADIGVAITSARKSLRGRLPWFRRFVGVSKQLARQQPGGRG